MRTVIISRGGRHYSTTASLSASYWFNSHRARIPLDAFLGRTHTGGWGLTGDGEIIWQRSSTLRWSMNYFFRPGRSRGTGGAGGEPVAPC